MLVAVTFTWTVASSECFSATRILRAPKRFFGFSSTAPTKLGDQGQEEMDNHTCKDARDNGEHWTVTTVKTAKQAIDMLNNGNEIDIVLAEVDLPIAKGLKMLKCIARKKKLKSIPVIMMSSQDEVSVVVKCLRLGAADYLVKPLRTNELLNLWTHTWRRRHMRCQAEKDIFNENIRLVLSDHSDANTNSTTLLSEDTDDKNRTTHQEVTFFYQSEQELDTSPVKTCQNILSEDNALPDAVCSGKIFSWPRKMVLKVGQSSAFLNYVKSSTPTRDSHFSHADREAATPSEPLIGEDLVGGNIEGQNCWDDQEIPSGENSVPTSENVINRNTVESPKEFPILCHTYPNTPSISRTDGQIDVPGMESMFHLPVYLQGQPSFMQGCQGTFYDLPMQNATSLFHAYNVPPQSHHPPMMGHFAYHPVGFCLSSGHMPPAHLWSSSSSSHVPQSRTGPTERRAAALVKFKNKKKDRCYDKIRYMNRKRLAEKKSRVRGQFVRQMNALDVELNDSPALKHYDSDEEDEEPLSRELELSSSPEHDTYEY